MGLLVSYTFRGMRKEFFQFAPNRCENLEEIIGSGKKKDILNAVRICAHSDRVEYAWVSNDYPLIPCQFLIKFPYRPYQSTHPLSQSGSEDS